MASDIGLCGVRAFTSAVHIGGHGSGGRWLACTRLAEQAEN